MTPFRKGDDVAAVEHDDTGKPVEFGQVQYGTVTQASPLSVVAIFVDEGDWYFEADASGQMWCDGGRRRLVPVCLYCDMPILGDPTGRKWCSGECRDASDEGAYEQRYPSGVAT